MWPTACRCSVIAPAARARFNCGTHAHIIDIKLGRRHDLHLTGDSSARALRTLTAFDDRCVVVSSATACGRLFVEKAT